MEKTIKLWIMMLMLVVSGKSIAQQEYSIVFIGNSITYGSTHVKPQKTNPTVYCTKYLKEQGVAGIHAKNLGKSGKTSRDFMPGRKGYYGSVKKVAAELEQSYPKAQLVFSIMLGTNDAAIRTKKSCWKSEIFQKSINLMVDSLQALYPKAIFVLHQDPYFSPNVEKESGTKMDEACLKQMKAYWSVCQSISKQRNNVYLGDNQAFDFFEKNHKTMMTPEEGLKGTYYLHPNESGAKELGKFWGEALLKVFKQIR